MGTIRWRLYKNAAHQAAFEGVVMVYVRGFCLLFLCSAWGILAQISFSMDFSVSVEDLRAEFIYSQDTGDYALERQYAKMKMGDDTLELVGRSLDLGGPDLSSLMEDGQEEFISMPRLSLVETAGSIVLWATVGHEGIDFEDGNGAVDFLETVTLETVLTKGTYQDYLDGETVEFTLGAEGRRALFGAMIEQDAKELRHVFSNPESAGIDGWEALAVKNAVSIEMGVPFVAEDLVFTATRGGEVVLSLSYYRAEMGINFDMGMFLQMAPR